MRVVYSREINAPPHRVFEVFSDLPNAAERISGIESVEMLTDGPVGKGTRWTETRKMMGKLSSETMTITGFDPPKSYTAEAESCGAHYTSVFTFEPAGEGTRVTMTFEGRPVSLFAKLMMPLGALMSGALKKMIAKDLDDLARYCEGGGKTGS